MFAWKAFTQRESGRLVSIVTVLANTRSEAQEKVRHELGKNASREGFSGPWETQGAMVMPLGMYNAVIAVEP